MFFKFSLMLAVAVSIWLLAERSIAQPQQTAEWTIRGDNSAVVERATVDRLTGRTSVTSGMSEDTFSLIWPSVELQARGRATALIRLELTIQVGHTMSVGEHTPYPGLITKIDDARGRISNLSTGRTFELRLSERGAWAGRFIHSDSHGSDHLAVEFPFSLFDEESSALVAQSKLLGRFDLSDRDRPHVPVLRFSPTEFRELRQQTVDLGSAIESSGNATSATTVTDREKYRARVEESKVWGVAGRQQFSDLFAMESLALYGCGATELMQLELRAAAFERSDGSYTPPVSVSLRYAPDLIDPINKVAYLFPLTGQLTIQGKDGSRMLEIGSGNHGLIASKAFLKEDEVWLDLGVTLRDELQQPVVARLTVKCSASDANCNELKLETAVDPDGRTMSGRSLSSIFERRDWTSPSIEEARRINIAQPLGVSPGCPGLCPTCMVEGCSVGSGACWDAGAPIGCTAGCTHYANQVQCCRGGFSRMCCVKKCATPP